MKVPNGPIAGDFDRHLRACDNAVLPGGHLPVRIGAAQVGFIDPARLPALAGLAGLAIGPDAVSLEPRLLDALGRGLAARGLTGFRDEAFDVRATPDGPVLGLIDRGALPIFGIQADGVHLNGLVRRAGGIALWVARRAADKKLDPGKLDHIAAGGVPAGLSPWQTLIKEAGEEAAIPPDLAAQSRPVARISYAMQRPEGLRRDRLHVYDLWLAEEFQPVPADGEVEAFELWPLDLVVAAVRDTERFKFNVNLVLVDLFRRLGVLPGRGPTPG